MIAETRAACLVLMSAKHNIFNRIALAGVPPIVCVCSMMLQNTIVAAPGSARSRRSASRPAAHQAADLQLPAPPVRRRVPEAAPAPPSPPRTPPRATSGPGKPVQGTIRAWPSGPVADVHLCISCSQPMMDCEQWS